MFGNKSALILEIGLFFSGNFAGFIIQAMDDLLKL